MEKTITREWRWYPIKYRTHSNILRFYFHFSHFPWFTALYLKYTSQNVHTIPRSTLQNKRNSPVTPMNQSSIGNVVLLCHACLVLLVLRKSHVHLHFHTIAFFCIFSRVIACAVSLHYPLMQLNLLFATMLTKKVLSHNLFYCTFPLCWDAILLIPRIQTEIIHANSYLHMPIRHSVQLIAREKDRKAQRYVILVQYVSVGTVCNDQMEMVSCCQNTTEQTFSSLN